MSWIVKAGKQGKKIVKKLIMPAEKHYVGYTRRIERVQTTRRICAMTFDDGPMGLPASPDRFDGRTLTDVLLDTLAQYGAREYLPGFDAAVEDLTRLHALMQTRYGYTMTLARPPHYVDKMTGGFTSYDVYDHMGYQYMAASFDGAGWLPSTDPDPEAALQAEIRAMVEPMRKALEKDPDFFCGQIIFQKDGYNMAKRTPVAFALGKQLALLKEYGYRVVSVGELMEESPFTDVGRDDPLFEKLVALAKTRAIVFTDNKLRLDDKMTVGELAMLLAPRDEALSRRVAQLRKTGKAGPYDGAMSYCRENGLIDASTKAEDAVTKLPDVMFGKVTDFTRRNVYAAYKMEE